MIGADERKRSVVFVGTATAFSLLGDQALYAVLPVYYSSLGISAFEVGLVLSANRWIRLLTNDLAHRLGSGRHQKMFFLAAFVLGAATTACYAVYSSFVLLLGARLAWGLSWSFIRHLGVQSIMADPSGSVVRAGHTMGLYNGISRAGSVAGLLGGALVVDLLGFVAGMLWLGLFSLLSLPFAAIGHRDADPLTQVSKGRLPSSLAAAGFAVGVVGPGFVMSTLGASLVRYVPEDTLFSAATLTGVVLATRYAMDAFAAPWLGGLSDRFGPRRAGRALFLGGGLALIFAALSPPLALFLVLVLLFFVCGTGLHAGLAGSASRLGSGAFSRYVTAVDFGSAIGPLVGWLVVAELGDPMWSLGLGGLSYLIALGVLSGTRKNEAGLGIW